MRGVYATILSSPASISRPNSPEHLSAAHFARPVAARSNLNVVRQRAPKSGGLREELSEALARELEEELKEALERGLGRELERELDALNGRAEGRAEADRALRSRCELVVAEGFGESRNDGRRLKSEGRELDVGRLRAAADCCC